MLRLLMAIRCACRWRMAVPGAWGMDAAACSCGAGAWRGGAKHNCVAAVLRLAGHMAQLQQSRASGRHIFTWYFDLQQRAWQKLRGWSTLEAAPWAVAVSAIMFHVLFQNLLGMWPPGRMWSLSTGRGPHFGESEVTQQDSSRVQGSVCLTGRC
jgi:hypothetical protein